MDTDGSCDNKGHMEYSTASKQMADDIVELITGLGGKVRSETRETWFNYKGERKVGMPSNRLHIFIESNPFRLPRKRDRFRTQDRYKHERVITKIEPIGKQEAMCITVDNQDSSYLVTRNHIVTHNSFALQNKAMMWCTDVEFREKQWGDNLPKTIWYTLPTQEHINDFFHEKWEPEFLARDESKKEGPYAWKVVKKNNDIKGIKFLATNCTLNFVTLKASSSSHQGRSVGGILFDEEPDAKKLSELETRTASFNHPETGLSTALLAFAFTPTSAQEYFKSIFSFQDEKFLANVPEDLRRKFFWDKETESFRTCSLREASKERFPASDTVWKRRVSMFEACKYRSGKRGKFTHARIRQFINDQPTRRDKLVRAFAQFEKEDMGGLLYKNFNRDIHTKYIEKTDLAKFKVTGMLTAGLDYGSGSNHPGGVVITWVSDDRKQVKVIKMWRGIPGKVTTAGDIVEKYLEMSKGLNIEFPFYDFSCADLKTIYNRMTGKDLISAAKAKEGYGFVDLLFKNNMIQLLGHEDEPYIDWASVEYENISHHVDKTQRTDEISDCVRYSLYGIAHLFDLENLIPVTAIELKEKIIDIIKTPEDYGVRSWSNVKEPEKEDDWTTDELEDWEGYFHD